MKGSVPEHAESKSMNLRTEIREELWQAVQRSYEAEAWANAILDAIHHLSDALRQRSGLESDGTALAGQALGGKAPKLRLSRLETESEKNVQAGVEQLLRGIYLAVRNPRSHSRIDDSKTDADAIIVFVDYVLRVLGQARSAFSVEDTVARVIDPDFVPSDRYARLVLETVPPRQRLQVGLAVFRQKTAIAHHGQQMFFKVLLDALGEDEREELLEAISAELRTSTNDLELRATFRLLPEERWPLLEETARLRAEHRIVRDTQAGRHRAETDKCIAGGMATWSARFWQHFSLKDELLGVTTDKLGSPDTESEAYALKFMLPWAHDLASDPPGRLEVVVLRKLTAGDARYHNAMSALWKWSGKWGRGVAEAQGSFQAAETIFGGGPDDDIPF